MLGLRGVLVAPGRLLCSQLKQLAISDTCVAASQGELTPFLFRCWLRLNPGKGTSMFWRLWHKKM